MQLEDRTVCVGCHWAQTVTLNSFLPPSSGRSHSESSAMIEHSSSDELGQGAVRELLQPTHIGGSVISVLSVT